MSRFPRRPQPFDHADWLGLIDVSGPFLSLPVLKKTWPSLDALDKPTRERLRLEHAAMPGREWIEYVLADLLQWGDALHWDGLDGLSLVNEHATVTPDFALVEPGEDVKPDTVRLLGLVTEGHPTQRVKGSDWAASPADRLAQLCRAQNVPLGLATDGRWWTLVWAPRGGVTTWAVFDSVNWNEAAERDVVRAFVSILRRSRFFNVPDGETLPALLEKSKDSQEDITEALGVQVRQAVELIVAALGRAHTLDVKNGGEGLGGVKADEVYRGAVSVMMRVVFLLFAEERGLLPSDKELYRTSYGIGTLGSELERRVKEGSEEDLEHTTRAWHRLLAAFNAVYYGVDHPELKMHAHGGSIFDPEAYPWLLRLAIDDRTVLHVLRAVQFVQIGTGRNKERRKLSFSTLDVEEIGYVYEGLLSYEARYAEEVVVGLVGKEGHEAEVPLRELELLRQAHPSAGALAAELAVKYKDSKIGTAKGLEKRLQPLASAEEEEAKRKLLAVTDNDYPLMERLLPFYGIIRTDLRDQPFVILTDALYVTESSLRKNTGTHYTPRNLAEEVVEGALEPLVYSPGPLQTADVNEWKPKSSQEILSLKIADIAMGSAAFLVAACRYLAGHLVEAWIREEDPRVAAYQGKAQDGASGEDTDPLVVEARRQVIEHCLYGVDINPMAVEMAKLSLWLVSMDPERPFTFLDDRLIAGDSLLGITSVEQLEWLHLDPVAGRKLYEDGLDFTADIRGLIADLVAERRKLTELDGTTLEGLAEKQKILARITRRADRLDLLADLITAAYLSVTRGANSMDAASQRALDIASRFLGGGTDLDGRFAPAQARALQETAREKVEEWLRTDLPAGGFDREPVHWPLVFPEVFDSGRAGGGFDAIIGNPPFLGGQKLTGAMGTSYREYLVDVIGEGARGSADLVAYFLLRAHALIHTDGQTGLIATNTLAQGDTREVGLQRLCDSGTVIRRAVKSARWPAKSAVLEYCAVWTSKEVVGGKAERIVGGVKVSGITASLDPESRVTGVAQRLSASSGIAFQGSTILGLGFTMEPERAKELIEKDPQNKDVLSPYLNGQDLNSRPDASGSRWVINFHDWPKERAKRYSDCYQIVLREVKPERDRNNREVYRKYWWQYAEKRPAMIAEISNLRRVIVIALVSKTVMPVMVPTGQVFSHMLGVFATDDTAMLALLSSAPHYWWAVSRASTMKNDIRYTPSDVFETLPLPGMTEELRGLGDRLDGFRRDVMLARDAGLTKTYNLVHDPACRDADIRELREIHRQIDAAVCRAYGWDDLVDQLGHGHHDLGRETRYTVAPQIQREFVDRLLELNHERYAAEVAAGLHGKKGKVGGSGKVGAAEAVSDDQGDQGELF